jgi:hypothetical protein
LRNCIASVPSTLSLREIADRETRQRSDSSRTDHLSKARAARSWAPLIGELEIIRFESSFRPRLFANTDKPVEGFEHSQHVFLVRFEQREVFGIEFFSLSHLFLWSACQLSFLMDRQTGARARD